MFDATSRFFGCLVRLSGLPALVAGIAIGAQFAGAREPPPPVVPLLSSGTTIVGEPIFYPSGSKAKITAAIIALPPGGETGWHMHAVPVFGYMLDGEITVDYGAHGKHVYRAGDSLIEAIGVAHNGGNTGPDTARILAVFMGAEGLPTSSPAAEPK